ncbi:hypothetical protein ACXZ65_38025 [Streptomyces aculeolatus]
MPVHIGQPEPGSEQALLEQEIRQRDERWGPSHPARVPGGLDWNKHGLEPRWLGMETSDCIVALEPGIFHNRGAGEQGRFLDGARRRGELALVVAVIGDADGDGPRSPLSIFDASFTITINKTFTSVRGRRLPTGARPEMAPDLNAADRDLALRLLNRPAGAPWWSLHLSGALLERGDGSGSRAIEAEGELHPILVDALGDPVVAAWTPPADGQRWYFIPDATDWNQVLSWLMHQALPRYVPGALRRARVKHFLDPDLQTAKERAAQQALEELQARYASDKQRLEQDLHAATTHAEQVRDPLLYGTGAELVRAVAMVLSAAGLDTVDLDEELGATASADLLVSAGGSPRRLVEVKSAGGRPKEDLVGDLQRHLGTWPQLRPKEPVTGGVLIVNHQHKLPPSERTASVYTRHEFVAALPVPVLSTVELFHWLRAEDWAAIRTAVLGSNLHPAAATTVLPQPAASETAVPRRRRWWPGGRVR